MIIEGLLRKYKLSKILDNLVLSDEEYELCKLLDKYFTNLKKMVRNDVNDILFTYYFNQENVLILEVAAYDIFNDGIDACVNSVIFEHIYKSAKLTTEETYTLIREWLGEGYTDKTLFSLLDNYDCTSIYNLLNNKKLKLID